MLNKVQQETSTPSFQLDVPQIITDFQSRLKKWLQDALNRAGAQSVMNNLAQLIKQMQDAQPILEKLINQLAAHVRTYQHRSEQKGGELTLLFTRTGQPGRGLQRFLSEVNDWLNAARNLHIIRGMQNIRQHCLTSVETVWKQIEAWRPVLWDGNTAWLSVLGSAPPFPSPKGVCTTSLDAARTWYDTTVRDTSAMPDVQCKLTWQVEITTSSQWKITALCDGLPFADASRSVDPQYNSELWIRKCAGMLSSAKTGIQDYLLSERGLSDRLDLLPSHLRSLRLPSAYLGQSGDFIKDLLLIARSPANLPTTNPLVDILQEKIGSPAVEVQQMAAAAHVVRVQQSDLLRLDALDGFAALQASYRQMRAQDRANVHALPGEAAAAYIETHEQTIPPVLTALAHRAADLERFIWCDALNLMREPTHDEDSVWLLVDDQYIRLRGDVPDPWVAALAAWCAIDAAQQEQIERNAHALLLSGMPDIDTKQQEAWYWLVYKSLQSRPIADRILTYAVRIDTMKTYQEHLHTRSLSDAVRSICRYYARQIAVRQEAEVRRIADNYGM
jgi:uncharacterized protein YukE